MNRTALIVPVIVQVACTADPNFEMFTCKDAETTNCVEIPVEEADELSEEEIALASESNKSNKIDSDEEE